MKVVLIEATTGFNWGKFMVARFEPVEWEIQSAVGNVSILRSRGWTSCHVMVFDLETCEGAAFFPGGLASADLDKHRVWVCPLFEPFLTWLYDQDLTDLDALPKLVELKAPFDMRGYRREGKS